MKKLDVISDPGNKKKVKYFLKATQPLSPILFQEKIHVLQRYMGKHDVPAVDVVRPQPQPPTIEKRLDALEVGLPEVVMGGALRWHFFLLRGYG